VNEGHAVYLACNFSFVRVWRVGVCGAIGSIVALRQSFCINYV